MSDLDDNILQQTTAKKRKKTGRMSEVKKLLKLSSHESGGPCNCKRLNCFNKINEIQRKDILRKFNCLKSNNEQNSYLAGLITIMPVQTRRIRNSEETAKLRDASFAYRVRCVEESGGVNDVEVCRKAFLSIHGISESKVMYIQQSLKNKGTAPVDMRGKHSSAHRSLNDETKTKIMHHIKSFKGRSSHYGLKDSKKTYLPPELNIKKMFGLFNELHPTSCVSYDTYRDIFNTKFNISFGYPRTDTCAECDEFTAKLKALGADADKRQIENLKKLNLLHKKKAQAFYDLKTKAKKESRKNKKKVAICLDFAKNSPLPNIATNDVYYKRQLSMYSFNIHELSTGKSYFYVYHECIAKKGANEVISFLFHFINNFMDDGVEELEIFCDSAAGQNKNYAMFRFIHYITTYEIHGLKRVSITFPIRGHSYMECDKNVGLWDVKKVMELPKEFKNMIKSCRSKPSPFKVVNVTKKIVLDWTTFLGTVYIKKCPFKTQPIKIIRASSDHKRLIHYRTSYFGGMMSAIIKGPGRSQQQGQRLFELPTPAYERRLPMSRAKYEDLMSLMKFCGPEARDFYRGLPVSA